MPGRKINLAVLGLMMMMVMMVMILMMIIIIMMVMMMMTLNDDGAELEKTRHLRVSSSR